jgi:pimeloyl-ACP methyl ester carboxylesterase
MRERALAFGKSARLVGVLAEPVPSATADLPAVLMLNPGILHRVGAGRLHVRLARALAAVGFRSLRFDLSGIGDSEPRRDSLPHEHSGTVEVREAMDHLAATTGAGRFVLLGLCSGADLAFETARTDDRVVGLVLLDGWSYRTWRFWLRHYGQRLMRPAVWRNSMVVRMNRLLGRVRGAAEPREGLVIPLGRGLPPKRRMEMDLQMLVSRGVQLYCLYTGSQHRYFNYRRQLHDAFPAVRFGNQLYVEYLPDATHILTALSHQVFVLGSIVEWVSTRFSLSGVPGAEQRRAAAG